ncbi:MAG: pseudouridine synthase [Spirochaetota bacterium]
MVNQNSERREAGIRLHVYLAHCGVGSRRKCEQYIREGRVAVNGRKIQELGFKCLESDSITFDGKRVRKEKRKLYIALNKPPGYLCSQQDPEQRPLALDLLKRKFPERIYSVGRLDFLSSGLLFFTNDGDFAKIVSHPSSNIEKEYYIQTKEPMPSEMLETFLRGITVDGVRYKIKKYKIKNPTAVFLTLTEGKNREIRYLLSYKGFTIKKIYRTRIGCVTVEGIKPGGFRMLTVKEIRRLTKTKAGVE